MFSNLLGKIFAHAPAPATTSAPTPAAPAATAPASPDPGLAAGGAVVGAAGAIQNADMPAIPGIEPAVAASQSVDVGAILDGLAAKNSEDLDWKKSIVDLLKLVGMDSSLSARKELATDLKYSGDESDSATMNGWLHKEVLKKLAENGGKVPQELLG